MRILISIFLVLVCLPVIAQRPGVHMSTRLAAGPLENASVGVCVIDLFSGEVLHAENADMRMVPASTLKVVTSRMALDQLGADFRFRTTLSHTGKIETGILKGDLVWIGDGDPTLGNEELAPACAPAAIFEKILERIRSLGIEEIQGRVIIVDTLYREEEVPRTWLWEDISNYYGAGVHGFNFMGNRYGITFDRSEHSAAMIPIERIQPQPPGLKVTSRVRFGPKGSGDQAYVFGGPLADSQVVRGTIPPGDGPFTIYAANHDPALLAAEMLLGFLQENGIRVTSGYEVYREVAPDVQKYRLSSLYTHESPTLSKVIEWMLRESDNLVAEALLKKCAQLMKVSTQTDCAAKELMNYMKKNAGVGSVSLFDGSGLSPLNRISARDMAGFLRITYLKDDFGSWLAMMPSGNEVYGAAQAIPDVSCLMHTHLKSGSMTSVLNFAGYLRKRDGSLLGISAFISDFTCSRNLLRKHFFEFMYKLCVKQE